MDTIAFKRRQKKPAKTTKTPTRTMNSNGGKSVRRGFPWWIVVLIVIVVAVTGLVVLRFSRASEQGTAPLTADQLKAYVQTQLVSQDISTTQTLQVSNYAEFQYGSKLATPPAYVSYYIDDVPVAKVTTSPFSYVLDTSRISNGAHTLTAVAFDSNDQPLGATQRTIEVNNAGGVIQGAKNVVTYPWYWLLQL